MLVYITTAMWSEYTEVNNILAKKADYSADITGLYKTSATIFKYQNIDIVSVKLGIGKIPSIIRLGTLPRPNLVINVGFAAGSKYYKPGQILVPTTFQNEGFSSTAEPIEIAEANSSSDSHITSDFANYLDQEGFIIVPICISSSQFVTKNNIDYVDPDRLAQVYDMEAYALATYCDFNQIKFFSVKKISDIPESLDPESHFQEFKNVIKENLGNNFNFLEKIVDHIYLISEA